MKMPPRKSDEQIEEEMRDKIALKAMECLILKPEELGLIPKDYIYDHEKAMTIHSHDIAVLSYKIADEMLKTRENKPEATNEK